MLFRKIIDLENFELLFFRWVVGGWERDWKEVVGVQKTEENRN